MKLKPIKNNKVPVHIDYLNLKVGDTLTIGDYAGGDFDAGSTVVK